MLATVGMRVDTDEGRRILKDAGALVDEATRIVRFPPALVEESLKLAPRRFSLGGRRPGGASRSTPASRRSASTAGRRSCSTAARESGGRARYDDWREAMRLMRRPRRDRRAAGRRSRAAAAATPWPAWVDYVADTQRELLQARPGLVRRSREAPWLLETLEIVFGGRDEVRRLHPYSFLLTPVSPLILEAPGTDAWLALRG